MAPPATPAANGRDALEIRAEILKLARLLRRDPATLAYLEPVPAADLRALREQVTDVLFNAHDHVLGRLATASKLLPIRIVAAIGERAFGPVLAARITGLLEPARAVEMAETMPTAFLADVAVELDPRRASEVIGRIPPQRIAEISRELLRRDEHVTMGRFVGHLSDDAVRAALGEMDDAALLRVAFVLEGKEGVDRLVGLLSPERIDAVVAVAAHEDLWTEVLDLLSHLSSSRRAALFAEPGRLAALSGDGVLESFVRAAAEQDMWPELLPLVPALPEDSRRRVATAVAALPSGQRESVGRLLRDAGLAIPAGGTERP